MLKSITYLLASLLMGSVVPAEEYVWNWRDAVVAEALIEVYDNAPQAVQDDIFAYAKEVSSRLQAKVHGTHPNGVASGCLLAFLQRTDPENPLWKELSAKVWQQYRKIPRTEQGALSHRNKSVELWDDTLYMISLYLLNMYKTTGEKLYLDECVAQILLHADVLRDRQTGLWYHGWSASRQAYDDGCCEKGWNDNEEQRSGEFWGRGNGWIAMTLVNTLSVMSPQDEHYSEIKEMYTQMMDTLCALADKKTGLWYQLPVYKEDKENFIETSASAMFALALARGAFCGLGEEKYMRAAKKAWKSLRREYLLIQGNELSLRNICAGTCIGSKEYYYARALSTGETYAYGVMLMLESTMK